MGMEEMDGGRGGAAAVPFGRDAGRLAALTASAGIRDHRARPGPAGVQGKSPEATYFPLSAPPGRIRRLSRLKSGFPAPLPAGGQE